MKRLRRTLKKSKLNPWVYDILTDYDCRIEVYCGGAGSGKSYGAMQKMLLKAMNEVRTVLVVRKVAKTLYHSVFRLTVDLLLESGMYPYAQIKRGDGEIHLANGSKFIFKGIDDPEKIKSITGITDIVVEEATELTEQDFLQLDLRLRPQAPHPQIFVMFNPVSKASWVYRYFFEEQREDCRVIRTSYRDNLFLSKEYVKRLQELEQLNPAYYRIYTLGEFVTLDKLVFPQVEVRLISPEEVEGLEFFCGMDFGYVNDPTAIIWGWYDKGQRRILVTGEYFAKGMNNRAIANVLTQLGLRKECITADSSEPKSIEELKELGIPRIRGAKKGKCSVLYGISWLNSHHLVVDERCKGLREEMENYTWKRDKQGDGYENVPIDTFNHGIDALRYGLEHRMQRQGMQIWKERSEG